jgi:hypothetical protein
VAAPANPVARTLGVASVLKDARKAAVPRGPVMGTGKRRGARRSRKRAGLPGFGGAFGAKNRFSPAGRRTGITAQRPQEEGLREAGPLFVRPSPLCTVV